MRTLLVILLFCVRSLAQPIQGPSFFLANSPNLFDPNNHGVRATLSGPNNNTAACKSVSGNFSIARSFYGNSSGKVYAEITIQTTLTSGNSVGLCNSTENLNGELGFDANGYAYVTFSSTGYSYTSNISTAVIDYYVAGDVISIALDLSLNVLHVYRNGSATPEFTFTSIPAGTWYVATSVYSNGNVTGTYVLNDGSYGSGIWDSRTASLRSTLSAAGYTNWLGKTL